MAEAWKEIYDRLYKQIDFCGGRWLGYMFALEKSYATAFDSQEKLLNKTKARIEARKKQEDQDRVFALTMLTAGTLGPIATHFSKKDQLETIKNVVGANQNLVDRALEYVGAKSQQIASEPYIPSAVTPAEYGAALRSGTQNRINVLKELALLLFDQQSDTAARARAESDSIQQWDFFTGVPPVTIDDSMKKTLDLRAKLALWIAWGLERDKKYWTIQSAMRIGAPGVTSEVYDWTDVRDELIKIQVPQAVLYHSGPKLVLGRDSGMNMTGFLNWVSSPNAIEALFLGLPHDDRGMRWVKDRWKQKLDVKT